LIHILGVVVHHSRFILPFDPTTQPELLGPNTLKTLCTESGAIHCL
jgi:hypothetical protein